MYVYSRSIPVVRERLACTFRGGWAVITCMRMYVCIHVCVCIYKVHLSSPSTTTMLISRGLSSCYMWVHFLLYVYIYVYMHVYVESTPVVRARLQCSFRGGWGAITCMCTHFCLYVYMYIYIYICMCMYMYVCRVSPSSPSTITKLISRGISSYYVHVYAFLFVCICIYICIYVCVCRVNPSSPSTVTKLISQGLSSCYMHVYAFLFVCIYIYMYICMCMQSQPQ